MNDASNSRINERMDSAMNDELRAAQNKQIRRTVMCLLFVAVCFYFGFIIATGMKG